jgi:hypothetical protein
MAKYCVVELECATVLSRLGAINRVHLTTGLGSLASSSGHSDLGAADGGCPMETVIVHRPRVVRRKRHLHEERTGL